MRAQGLRQKTTAEWLVLFDELQIPAARYNSIDDLFDDPHLADVGFFETIEHPSEGRIRRTKVANTFSGGMRVEALPAPRLGEHTTEVLAAIGYDEAEVARMLEEGSAVQAEERPPAGTE